MVVFQTDLELTPVGPQRWRINSDLVCDTPFGRVVVPRGFVTDGASVPRPVWFLYPPIDGDYDAAAVLHDWAYRNAELLGLNRGQADQLLKEGMVATGTAGRKRAAIYSAVRLGGWLPWRRARKAEGPQEK